MPIVIDEYTDDDDLIMTAEPPPPPYGTETEEVRFERLMASVARRKAGERFYTVAELRAHMKAAIESVKNGRA